MSATPDGDRDSRARAQSHPNLPGAVTFHQLEVLAQAAVGAEAHFEDLDSAAVNREVLLQAGICATLSWTGNLPGQGVARHHLVHGQGWLGTIIPTSFCQETDNMTDMDRRYCCTSAAGQQRDVANTNIAQIRSWPGVLQLELIQSLLLESESPKESNS